MVGELVINGGLVVLMIILDFFGFVGNWFSYVRLMVLVLVMGGIVMVINVFVGMVWVIKFFYIGLIIGLIIFFGG